MCALKAPAKNDLSNILVPNPLSWILLVSSTLLHCLLTPLLSWIFPCHTEEVVAKVGRCTSVRTSLPQTIVSPVISEGGLGLTKIEIVPNEFWVSALLKTSAWDDTTSRPLLSSFGKKQFSDPPTSVVSLWSKTNDGMFNESDTDSCCCLVQTCWFVLAVSVAPSLSKIVKHLDCVVPLPSLTTCGDESASKSTRGKQRKKSTYASSMERLRFWRGVLAMKDLLLWTVFSVDSTGSSSRNGDLHPTLRVKK